MRQGALSPSKVTVVARILNDTIHNAGWGPAAATPNCGSRVEPDLVRG